MAVAEQIRVSEFGKELTGAIHGQHGTFDAPEELVQIARQRAEDAFEAWR